jgi:hypothetical protein
MKPSANALRQVNLMAALKSRGAELSSPVAHLEALREVGRRRHRGTVSNVVPVFTETVAGTGFFLRPR